MTDVEIDGGLSSALSLSWVERFPFKRPVGAVSVGVRQVWTGKQGGGDSRGANKVPAGIGEHVTVTREHPLRVTRDDSYISVCLPTRRRGSGPEPSGGPACAGGAGGILHPAWGRLPCGRRSAGGFGRLGLAQRGENHRVHQSLLGHLRGTPGKKAASTW